MGCQQSKKSDMPPLPPFNDKVESSNKKEQHIVVAKFPYNAIQQGDLSFNVGDQLVVESVGDDKLWMLATNVKTKLSGFIPANYVETLNKSNPTGDCFLNISRMEAELQLLFAEEIKVGTFIIRPSADGQYALSIMSHNRAIKHYKIAVCNTKGKSDYYINSQKIMNSLDELITYYQKNNELCCGLTNPLKRSAPAIVSRKLVIPYDEFTITGELGQGNFGKVYKAKWKQHEVALKTLKDETASKTEFLDEAKIMHSLDNDYLVKLLGVSMNGNQSILCMEFMPKGHLLGVLKSDKGKNFNLDMLGRMAGQIASGMSYLSDQGLIHRDLRTENVLVNNSYICKIADFGLAKKSDKFQASHDTKFPVKWTALEAATQGKFSVKSDVWSYGILLWELVTFGEMPYKGMSGQDVLKNLKTGYRLPVPKEIPHKVPDKWHEQMMMCWDENPQNRPNFHALCDFFENSFNGTSDYVD